MSGSPRPVEADVDPIERDVDLAWELYEAQPTHPEIGRLAARVLAQQPGRNGIRMLLAMHRHECGEVDEARELLLGVTGQRDTYFVNAARELRDLELFQCNYAEARRWAEAVLRESQERWHDWLQLGAATAMAGDLKVGWKLLDDAVELCVRNEADDLSDALAGRAMHLFGSFAPSERFIPAAEEAMRADPTSEFVGGPLIWAYVHQGRFDDAETLAQRLLRQDPTDGLAEGALTMIRNVRAAVEKQGMSLADFHASGAVSAFWTQMRDQILGTDLASALSALDQVMPAELSAALRPPLDAEAAKASPGDRVIAAWHDGQEPGTGALWGVDGDFRLMSSAEITAMDEAIEADPGAYPEWPEEEISDYYAQVMTDDKGGYLIATLTNAVIRRAGADDVVAAPGLADWFWDRVAAFGGRDPRPATRGDAVPTTDDARSDDESTSDSLVPTPEVTAELDRLNDACRSAPGDTGPQIELWKAVTALDYWVCINRGTPEEPSPFALAADGGTMLCIFSSATRAKETAHASGFVPEGATVPLFAVPLPAALDWAMSFGQRGVAGVTIDHPQLGAWCPLPNLAQLRQMREQSQR